MPPIDESTTNSTSSPAGPAAPRRRWRFFNAIFTEYVPFVRRLIARRRGIVPASVEDLVLKVFTTLSQRMVKSEPIRNPEAMLVTIVGHELANRSRLKKPDVDPAADPSTVPCAEPDPEQHAELADKRRAIQAHLDAMDPEEAKLVVYHDILDMTYAEIATLEHRPESTVAYQYTRARAHLDERIREASPA